MPEYWISIILAMIAAIPGLLAWQRQRRREEIIDVPKSRAEMSAMLAGAASDLMDGYRDQVAALQNRVNHVTTQVGARQSEIVYLTATVADLQNSLDVAQERINELMVANDDLESKNQLLTLHVEKLEREIKMLIGGEDASQL